MAHKSYSTEAMTKAMEAVARGASASTAAKEYCVPRTTLLDKINGRSSVHCVKGPPTVLTKNEEEHLENWLIFMANSGFPVTKDQLQDSVSILLKKLGRKNPFRNDKPGRHWFEAFIKRHPKVGQRLAQNLSQTRASVKEEDIRLWFKEIEQYFNDTDLKDILEDPRRIFNCDESAFFLSPSDNRVLARRGSKNVYNVIPSGERECVTVLITANAAGNLAPPMVLYKLKSIPHKISKGAPSDWGLGHTAKGWMTGEAFYEYITNVFYPWLEKSHISVPIIFFLDGHCSHTTLPLSNFCREKKITLIALHPNATHLLQPMDVSVFRPLKIIWKKTVYEWRNENQFVKLKKEHFCPLLKKALTHLEPSTIANGFRKCGLSPFNANNVDYDKCVTSKSALNATKHDNSQSYSNKDCHLRFLESQISPSTLKAFHENKGSTWRGDTSFEALFNLWRKINTTSTETQSLPFITCDKSMLSELGNFTGYSNLLDTNTFVDDVSAILRNDIMMECESQEANEGVVELYEIIDGNLTKITSPSSSSAIQKTQSTIGSPLRVCSTGQTIRTIGSKPIYLTPHSTAKMSFPTEKSSNDKAKILSSEILTAIEKTGSATSVYTPDNDLYPKSPIVSTKTEAIATFTSDNNLFMTALPLVNTESRYYPEVECTPAKMINTSIASKQNSPITPDVKLTHERELLPILLSPMTTQTEIPYFTSVECTLSKDGDLSAGEITPYIEKRESPKKYFGDLVVPTPFKDALFWPEAPLCPNTNKVKIPSVITSDRWQIFAQKKSDKKTEKEKKRGEAKERNQKRLKKEQKTSTSKKITGIQRITQKGTGTQKVTQKDWFCRLCQTCAKLDMIQCLSCMIWYHTSCAEVQPSELSFYCIYCKDSQRK